MSTALTQDTPLDVGRRPLGLGRGILYGGLAVGVCDALDATLFTLALGGNPMRAWQAVASGFLRKEAYEGGMATVLLGLLIHFFIATCVATVYLLAARRLPMLWRKPWIWGPVYGVGVFFFMYFVVINIVFPTHKPFELPTYLNGIIGHALLVGLPAALVARKAFRG